MSYLKNPETDSGVYRIRNLTTGRCYYGSTENFRKRFSTHKRNLNRGTHHNIFLQRSWDKHGADDFIFEIVKVVPFASALTLLNEERPFVENNKCGYNIGDVGGGDNLSNHPNREDIIAQRIKSQLKTNAGKTKEERQALYGKPGERNGMYGRTHTPETRVRLSLVNVGRPSATKGTKLSSERKKALSVMAKARVGELNPFYGKVHTEETKAKIRAAMMGDNNYMRKIDTRTLSYTKVYMLEYQSGIRKFFLGSADVAAAFNCTRAAVSLNAKRKTRNKSGIFKGILTSIITPQQVAELLLDAGIPSTPSLLDSIRELNRIYERNTTSETEMWHAGKSQSRHQDDSHTREHLK